MLKRSIVPRWELLRRRIRDDRGGHAMRKIVVAAAASIVFAGLIPAEAQIVIDPPDYIYSTGLFTYSAQDPNDECRFSTRVTNLHKTASQDVQIKLLDDDGAVLRSQDHSIVPTKTDLGFFIYEFDIAGDFLWARLQMSAPTSRVVSRVVVTCGTKDVFGAFEEHAKEVFEPADWTLVGPRGSIIEMLGAAKQQLDAAETNIVERLGTPTDRELSLTYMLRSLTDLLNVTDARINTLAGKVGNRTMSTCTGGSVQNNAKNRSQMYVTIFPGGKGQTLSVRYFTTKGFFDAPVTVDGGKPTTIDVNRQLTQTGGPFPGATDLEVVVVVESPEPINMDCTLYTDRFAGIAGQLKGVTTWPAQQN